MNTIQELNFNLLRNEEFRSFHRDGVLFASKITSPDLQKSISDYVESFGKFSTHLTTCVDESNASKVGKLDRERNVVYSDCRRMAQISRNLPSSKESEIGEKVYKVFTSNPSPHHLNQIQSTGIIIKIIESLRLIGNDSLEKIGMKFWVDSLESVNDLYHDAYEQLSLERGNHVLNQTRTYRENCQGCYKELVKFIDAKSTLGDLECSEFAEKINGSIKMMHSKIRLRKKSSKGDEYISGKDVSKNIVTENKENESAA